MGARMKQVLCFSAIVLFCSCGPQKMIEHLETDVDGLHIVLDISPNREQPSLLNGKLRVANNSMSMLDYGNFRLFLEADSKQVVTAMRSRGTVVAQADTKPVFLSPGDSLSFNVEYDFGEKVNFNKAAFKLHYLSAQNQPSIPAP